MGRSLQVGMPPFRVPSEHLDVLSEEIKEVCGHARARHFRLKWALLTLRPSLPLHPCLPEACAFDTGKPVPGGGRSALHVRQGNLRSPGPRHQGLLHAVRKEQTAPVQGGFEAHCRPCRDSPCTEIVYVRLSVLSAPQNEILWLPLTNHFTLKFLPRPVLT